MNWAFRECGQCGERWPLGDSPTCKCSRFSYTTPLVPVGKREWQGLTDVEKSVIRSSVAYSQFMTAGEYAEKVQDATEAKLKEKNT